MLKRIAWFSKIYHLIFLNPLLGNIINNIVSLYIQTLQAKYRQLEIICNSCKNNENNVHSLISIFQSNPLLRPELWANTLVNYSSHVSHMSEFNVSCKRAFQVCIIEICFLQKLERLLVRNRETGHLRVDE